MRMPAPAAKQAKWYGYLARGQCPATGLDCWIEIKSFNENIMKFTPPQAIGRRFALTRLKQSITAINTKKMWVYNVQAQEIAPTNTKFLL